MTRLYLDSSKDSKTSYFTVSERPSTTIPTSASSSVNSTTQTTTTVLPHIFLLGGSGRTGRLVIAEALKRGHTVTAMVRRKSSLEAQRGLTVVEGDSSKKSDMARAVNALVSFSSSTSSSPNSPCPPSSTETPKSSPQSMAPVPVVVISTLGQTRKSGNPWAEPTSPARFMETTFHNLFAPLYEASAISGRISVVKIVAMSMFGAGSSWPQLGKMMQGVMRYSNMTRTVEDHDLVDAAVKESGFEYVMARPAMLGGEDEQGGIHPVKVWPDDGKGIKGFMPKITSASVAGFLLDAAVRKDWDGRTPVLSN